MTELNIINPKQLERQLKVVEGRIQELQSEMDGLERMRAACLVLMGNAVDFPAATAKSTNEEMLPLASKEKTSAAKPKGKRKEGSSDSREEAMEAIDGRTGLGDMPSEAFSGEAMTPTDLDS